MDKNPLSILGIIAKVLSNFALCSARAAAFSADSVPFQHLFSTQGTRFLLPRASIPNVLV